jgi:hypothetical protein
MQQLHYTVESWFWKVHLSLGYMQSLFDTTSHNAVPLQWWQLFVTNESMTSKHEFNESYVYWTVHLHDSWIKIDQLDVTCFIISLFTAQHVSDVSTSIFRSLWLIVDLFHVLYCSGSICVGVMVWFGWGGVVSLCRLKHCLNLHKDTTPPQPNRTIIPTHIEPEQYNTWNKSTISHKLLKMDVLTFETCWAVNSEIIKRVTSSWSIFIQLGLQWSKIKVLRIGWR